MSIIQRLDAHLTNMIAAGEVVERPMGVVKELVENSMDAGANNIEIHIKQGGLEEITIIDNGNGMSAQDASMAFERHATSKIQTMDDLWNISTMGFRGEALPSIASVSRVVLKTNDGGDSSEIEIQYGKLTKAGPIGTPKGTQISVFNLFQKTPARLKHLKTPQYEFSLISDIIQKFALSRSDIAFTLIHDGKEVLVSKGNGNTLETIMEIYGRDVAKQAMEVKGKDEDFDVQGYAVQPRLTRASKYYILFYINNRMIRSIRLQKAVLDAYRPYLPSDRYPIVILNIKLDPKLVDVNVHPSKWEVRLSKERQLINLINNCISDTLKHKLEVNQIERKEKERVEKPSFTFEYENQNEKVNTIIQEVKEEFASYIEKEIISVKIDQSPIEKIEVISEGRVVEEVKVANNPSLPQMEVIGQLHGCYILAQGEHGLYIVDQHAAQERYHYEQIQNILLNNKWDIQPLLVPLTIESSISAVTQMEDINTLLSQIGLTLEAFGNHTFILRELPLWVSGVEEEKFIQDMIDVYLKNNEINIEQLRKHALASLACHSSIRFNRNLSKEEMQQVIQDLRKCKQPFHCPHGRPTFIQLTLKELEKDFYRVK